MKDGFLPVRRAWRSVSPFRGPHGRLQASFHIVEPTVTRASVITHQRKRGVAERSAMQAARAGSVLTEQTSGIEIFGHGFSLAYSDLR